MNNLIILPTTLTVISTYRCTASCPDCCFGCNPKRQEELLLREILHYINECLAAYNTIKVVVVTGGECFLYGDDLRQIVKFVKSKGLFCRIVTNGYWATSYASAFQKLSLLKEDGLTEINFSTGDDHLQYVSLQRLLNGIKAALKLQITVVLNVETGKGRTFSLKKLLDNDEFKNFLNPLKYKKPLMIVRGQWMSFTIETLNMMLENEESKSPSQNQERCSNLFSALTISPIKHLHACCGLPSANIKCFDLGKIVDKQSIVLAYEHQFDDFLKIWLFTEGPFRVLKFIAQKTEEVPEIKYNFHMCFYCACIFGNKGYLKVLRENYKEVYHRVLLKYFLLKKRLAYVYS